MLKKIIVQILFLFYILSNLQVFAQKQKYWVFFSDKNISDKQSLSKATIQNRKLLNLPTFQESDLPIKVDYLDFLSKRNIEVIQKSKWLNAVSTNLTQKEVKFLQKTPFITNVQSINGHFIPTKLSTDYDYFSPALTQINAESLINMGLTGKGIIIGVIDVGFEGANNDEKLLHIFQNEQFLGAKDFVKKKNKKPFKAQTPSDWHGREVWKMIAGKSQNQIEGLASKAKFYLARTDHAKEENKVEEDYWIAAVEWLDNLGVRVINSSLGYAHHFNNSKDNYSPKDMDGQTSIVSKFAQIATQEKGLTIVVSAGNEGDTDWEIITAPADAQSVITVGASKSKIRSKIYYSSIGSAEVDYLKPNIVCPANMGTSFSAPIITGLIACLLEKKPDLNPSQIQEVLEQSGHLYPYGNNYVGYGVPQADVTLQIIDNQKVKPKVKKVFVKNNLYKIENVLAEKVVIFHKKNSHIVIKQEEIKNLEKQELIIERNENIQQTTVDLGGEIVEIIWE